MKKFVPHHLPEESIRALDEAAYVLVESSHFDPCQPGILLILACLIRALLPAFLPRSRYLARVMRYLMIVHPAVADCADDAAAQSFLAMLYLHYLNDEYPRFCLWPVCRMALRNTWHLVRCWVIGRFRDDCPKIRRAIYPGVKLDTVLDMGVDNVKITTKSRLSKTSITLQTSEKGKCAHKPSNEPTTQFEFLYENELLLKSVVVYPSSPEFCKKYEHKEPSCLCADHLLLLGTGMHPDAVIKLTVYDDGKTVRAAIIRVSYPFPEYDNYVTEESCPIVLPVGDYASGLRDYINRVAERFPELSIVAGSRDNNNPELEALLRGTGIPFEYIFGHELQERISDAAIMVPWAEMGPNIVQERFYVLDEILPEKPHESVFYAT